MSTDWHGDRDTLGVSRTSEVRDAVKQSVAHAIEINADAYLFAGDLADPDSGGATFRAQEIAIEAAHELSDHGIRSIWIAGNHDVNEDGTGATCLSPLAAIERSRGCKELLYVAETPRVVDLSEDLAVMCLPYVPISHGYSPSEYARGIFGSGERTDIDQRIITLSHLMIPGVVLGEETTEMPRGRDVAFPLAETARAVVRINGHYHTRQTTAEGILIPGALCRFTFGDERSEPGYLVIDL